MQIMKPLTLSLITTGLFSAFNVSAATETTLLTCNGCSPTQMEAVTQHHLRTHKDEFIAVVDYQNEQASKFQVNAVTNKYGKTVHELTTVELTTDEADNINAVIEARKALLAFMPESVVVNPESTEGTDGTKSHFHAHTLKAKPSFNFDYQYLYYGSFKQQANVYDFMQASYLRNKAYHEYFGDNYTTYLFSTLSKALISFKLPYEIYDGIGLHMNIQFENANHEPIGSAQVAIDPKKETFNVISASDADNNTVPVKKEDISGQMFAFGSDDNKAAFDSYIAQFSTATEKCQSVNNRQLGEVSLHTYQCIASDKVETSKETAKAK
ncbi:hypothetical protein [uncultured Shewanella sp.]|uniref:hypothetical protein n=1 Tax=uncultured Shewanella sp. TaxID=173975 RepID=UPI00261FCC37|nr:hypothetical protein [uncultured Shewanella sp.]